jgi:RNA polymerase sigma factor (sigma-70 family)
MFFKNKQDREDFWQYLRLQRLQGRNSKLRYIHTDWLRRTRGESRSKHHEKRERLMQASQLDEDKQPKEQLNPEQATVFKLYIMEILDKLCPEDHCIFFLKYVWGFTNREIAVCFGWHETNVWKRIKDISAKLV